MKTKLVLWGTDDKDEKVLMAIQLRAEDNQVDVWTFHGENATNDLHKQLLYEWREGKEMAFPESGYNHHESELSATGRLLPENIFPEKDELIERAKTEWHFVVLSSKLNEVYQIELTELREEIEGSESYSSEKWEKLKTFWDKVREQMQENNLARDHANSLKRQVNSLFSYLKDLRSAKEAEFQANSATTYEKFNKSLEEVNARIQKGEMLHLVFEELKSIQREFRSTQLTREDRSKLWPKIDGAFKAVKERRFGPSAGGGGGNSPVDRHQNRLNGLMEAIAKMERSIQRDKEDLKAQERKKDSSSIGQLESQLLDAKMNIIISRVKSKEDKLKNMHKTREDVEGRLAQAKRRAEERAAKAEEKAAAPTVEVPADVAKTVEVPADVAKVEEAAEDAAKTVEVPADVAKVEEAVEDAAKTVEVPADVAKTVEVPADVAKVEDAVEDAAKTVEVPADVAKTVEVPADVAKAAESVEEKVEAVKEEATEAVEETKAEAVEAVEEKVEEVEEVAEAIEEAVNNEEDAA